MDDIHDVGFAPGFKEELYSDGVDIADSIGWSRHELELPFSKFARRVSGHLVSEALSSIQGVNVVRELVGFRS